MHFVCPQPSVWHAIVSRCDKAWRGAGGQGKPPPAPLVLSGWAFSSDVEKQRRWKDLVGWAEERSLLHLVSLQLPEDGYYVHVLTDSYPGKDFGCQDHPPASMPNGVELAEAMHRLHDSWPVVAGPMARFCRPLKFTGDKARRLLVLVTGEVGPPWGGWTYIAAGEKRQEFTAFRRRVNVAIAPHHVDHVDFRVQGDRSGFKTVEG